MNEWFQGYRAVKFGFGVVILFFMSLFKSCTELKRSIWGIETTATVMEASPSGYREGHQLLRLRLQDEHGKDLIIKTTTSNRTPALVTGDSIDVIYMPGVADRAIPVHERSMAWPTTLAVMTIAGLVWMFIMMREAKAGRGV